MRIRNKQDHGVFVANHGVVAAGEEATVRESPTVLQLIKDGVFAEAKAASDTTTEEADG